MTTPAYNSIVDHRPQSARGIQPRLRCGAVGAEIGQHAEPSHGGRVL